MRPNPTCAMRSFHSAMRSVRERAKQRRGGRSKVSNVCWLLWLVAVCLFSTKAGTAVSGARLPAWVAGLGCRRWFSKACAAGKQSRGCGLGSKRAGLAIGGVQLRLYSMYCVSSNLMNAERLHRGAAGPYRPVRCCLKSCLPRTLHLVAGQPCTRPDTGYELVRLAKLLLIAPQLFFKISVFFCQLSDFCSCCCRQILLRQQQIQKSPDEPLHHQIQNSVTDSKNQENVL
jgi:hypothetical protein